MKRIISLLWISVFIGLSFKASAQIISWEIKQHSTDLQTLKEEVTEYVNDGYVPLGITYDNVELYILYVRDPEFGMEAWSIEWYDNRDAIQKGITGNMNKRYIPTGITYTGDQFYVLYVKTESSVTAWQLIPSAADLNSVKRAIQPYVNQGYVPTGISLLKDEYWTLLLQIPDTQVKKWKIETYPVGAHADGINSNIKQGYIPWGIEYRGTQIDILYIGF
jgi:hypothetical protein